MANVKFLTGTETNLLKKSNGQYVNPIVEGSLYVTAEKDGSDWVSNLYYDINGQRIKVGDTGGRAATDSMNQNIVKTYIKAISMEGKKYANTDGATLTYVKGDGSDVTILLPLASKDTAGTVNTGEQSFAGNKTFLNNLTVEGISLFKNNIHFRKDATMAIYPQTNTTYGTESVAIQTAFDDKDAQTTDYTSKYQDRCNLLLQPRGGQVYIGTNLTSVGNTAYALLVGGRGIYAEGNSQLKQLSINGNNTSVALYVGGSTKIQEDLTVEGSGIIKDGLSVLGLLTVKNYDKTVSIGAQNASYIHFTVSDSTVPFWFGNEIQVNKDLKPYTDNVSNLGISNKRWKSGHFGTGGISVAGAGSFNGHVTIGTNKTYDLGSDSKRWRKIYADQVIATTFNGALKGNVTGNLNGTATFAEDSHRLDGYHRSDLFTSIPTWINATGLTKKIEVGGDANTYYPVRITISTNKEAPQFISIWKNLGSKTPASYNGNHSNGTSSLWLQYEARSNTWDGNGGYCKTWYKYQGYATLVSNAQMAGSGVGDLIIWLRGGGCEYNISCTGTFTPTVYLTKTNLGSTSYPVNVEPRTTIGNGGIIEAYLGYGRVTYADKADVAVSDDANHIIKNHYLGNIGFDGTTNKTTKVVAYLYNGVGGTKATVDFPTATATQAGAVTTGAQTFAGDKTFTGMILFPNVTTGVSKGIQWTMGDNDKARIVSGATAANTGYLEIATADDANEPIHVRQYSGVFTTLKRTLTLLDASGDTSVPGSIIPQANQSKDIGTSSLRWSTMFAKIFNASTQFIVGGGAFYANSSGNAFATNNISIMKANTNYNLYNDGTSYFKGKIWNPQGLLSFVQNNTIVNATTDWNTLTTPGCYKVQMASWGNADTYHSPNKAQSDLYSYGLLFVIKGSDSDTEYRTLQIYFPHTTSTANPNYCRMLNGTSWQAWHKFHRGALDLTGGTMTGTIKARDILPVADNTYVVGNSSLRWKSMRAYTYYADTQFITASGGFKADNNGRMYVKVAAGLGVAADTSGKYVLKVTGNSLFNGILYFANNTTYYINNSADAKLKTLRVVNLTTLEDGLRIGDNDNGDTSYIAFYGTPGDRGTNAYDHTFIGENRYDSSKESSELLLFKGNDVGSNTSMTTAVSPGPDRIRHLAAGHLFQVMTAAISGAWTDVKKSDKVKNIFEIFTNGTRTHGTAYYASGSTYFIDNSGRTNLFRLTLGNGGNGVNDAYQLYVKGSSYHNGDSYFYKKIYIRHNESTDSSTFLRFLASDDTTRASIIWNGNTTNSENSTTHLDIQTNYGDIRLTPKTTFVTVRSHLLLATSGATEVTLRARTKNYTSIPLTVYDDGTTYGHSMVLESGGSVYVGAGESGKELRNALRAATATKGIADGENLFLSGTNIYFYSNCDTIGNKWGAALNTAGQFYPLVPNTGEIGLASYRWNYLRARHLDLAADNTGVVPLIIRGGSGDYKEGMRILGSGSATGWATITLGGNKVTGVDANTWAILTYQRQLFITHNESSAESSMGYLHAKPETRSNKEYWYWKIGPKLRVNTNTSDYALNASSFICDDWVRTKGNTGWYNQTHGGGWYMTDSSYVRSYGKPVMMGHNIYFNSTNNYVNTSGNARFNTVGINGANTTYRLYVNGSSYLTGYLSVGAVNSNYKLYVSGTTLLTGNVGIGEYSGSYKLYVSGNSYFKGNVDISNTLRVAGLRPLYRNKWWSSSDTSKKVDNFHSGITFAYGTHGAPTVGTLVAFSCDDNENYTLQLQGNYNGENLYFRNRNGDNGKWNAWRYVVHSGNFATVLDGRYVNVTGDTMTGNLRVPQLLGNTWVRANYNASGTDGGITLYSSSAEYGIMFRTTGNLGKHGWVNSDWATYFTMSNSAGRGWVFRRWGSGNVASISTDGNVNFNGALYCGNYIQSNQRIFTGYDSGQRYSVSASNWFRSSGNTGWINDTHGGGIYMTDSTWVRVYGSKLFYVSSTHQDAIHTSGGINASGEIRSFRANGFRLCQGSRHVILRNDGGHFWFLISTSSNAGDNWNSLRPLYFNLNNGYVYGTRLYNAVWNDYAEYRASKEDEPGRVVLEDEYGVCQRATERLQPFAGVISDTYGFCQGETEKAKTPLAVAGRALVYTYQDRNNYKVGDCVCAAPDGTVDIMTREEIINYPDRIVGTVSEIPNYKIWGSGNVKVNGRIWIKVK